MLSEPISCYKGLNFSEQIWYVIWRQLCIKFVFIATLLSATCTMAAVVVNVYESNSSVLFDYSGSIDLTGEAIAFGPTNDSSDSIRTDPISFRSNPNDVPIVGYAMTTLFPPVGTSSSVFFGSATGDMFSIQNGRFSAFVLLDASYVSGEEILGRLELENQSFLSMQLVNGSYSASLANGDSVTINVGLSQVPLPASLPLVAISMGAFIAVGRRKRQKLL